jgi:para-nitrobenzyl esterase
MPFLCLGDPSKVLIFGESAGGESVLIHLASPKASGGLFTSALAESGPMSLNFKVQIPLI